MLSDVILFSYPRLVKTWASPGNLLLSVSYSSIILNSKMLFLTSTKYCCHPSSKQASFGSNLYHYRYSQPVKCRKKKKPSVLDTPNVFLQLLHWTYLRHLHLSIHQNAPWRRARKFVTVRIPGHLLWDSASAYDRQPNLGNHKNRSLNKICIMTTSVDIPT